MSNPNGKRQIDANDIHAPKSKRTKIDLSQWDIWTKSTEEVQSFLLNISECAEDVNLDAMRARYMFHYATDDMEYFVQQMLRGELNARTMVEQYRMYLVLSTPRENETVYVSSSSPPSSPPYCPGDSD